jgi:hypothetical protein
MLWKNFRSYFIKKNSTKQKEKQTNPALIDIQVSLTDDFDIDISMEFIDLVVNEHDKELVEKVAKFFHLFSTETFNVTLANILVKNIASENEEYKTFVTKVVANWLLLQKTSKIFGENSIIDTPVVSPNQVFLQHYGNN